MHPEDAAVVRSGIELALKSRSPDFSNVLSHRFLLGTGETGHLVVRYGVRRDSSNQVIGLFGLNQDVTAEIRNQVELERQAALLEMAQDAIIVRDAEDRIVFWSRGAEETYGWSREQALGFRASELYDTERAPARALIKAEAGRTGQWEGELRHRHRDGREVLIASRWAVTGWRTASDQVFLEINRDVTRRYSEQDWVKTNLARFGRLLSEHRNLPGLCAQVLTELAPLVRAQSGAIYVADEQDGAQTLHLTASYAISRHVSLPQRIEPGEGLVGQCALDQRSNLINGVPLGYLDISSSLGKGAPANIAVFPAVAEGTVKAVIELASFDLFSQSRRELIEGVMHDLGMAVSTLQAHTRTSELLKETQSLAAELQTQNKRLEEQAGSLRESKAILEQQRQELELSNSQLRLRARELGEERARIALKNEELEATRAALSVRARQLSTASHYKSEFLANMSHELRTPLNAMVVLADVLAENRAGNLESAQLTHLATIGNGARELLRRIGEILDLSKIEAGKMDVSPHPIALGAVCDHAREMFLPLAREKGLQFDIRLADDLPPGFCTDQQRLQQILGNLLSNALKFTEKGAIVLSVRWARSHERFSSASLCGGSGILAFEVTDTGIGVAADKLDLIWGAFEQVDGSISRRYGGSGLGLALSREFADLLGGEIQLESTLGTGSRFTLFLPLEPPERRSRDNKPAVPARVARADAQAGPEDPVPPQWGGRGRKGLRSGRRFLWLGGEDSEADEIIARIRRICTPEPEILRARRGEEGLALACHMRPDAIFLQAQLGGIGGWEVLARLNTHPDLCHIPVVMLAPAEHRLRGLRSGAARFLPSPPQLTQVDEAIRYLQRVTLEPRRQVLAAVAHPADRAELVALVGDAITAVTVAETAGEVSTALEKQAFDCMLLNSNLPGLAQSGILARLAADPALADLPVVVWGDRTFGGKEANLVNQHQRIRVLLDDQPVPPRLLEETLRILHRSRERAVVGKPASLSREPYARAGGRVLIISRQMRVVYPLTGLLEHFGLKVRAVDGEDPETLALQCSIGADLIVLHAEGGVRQGIASLAEVRRGIGDPRVPVLVLAADSAHDDPLPWLEAGVAGMLSSPDDREELSALLQLWLPAR